MTDGNYPGRGARMARTHSLARTIVFAAALSVMTLLGGCASDRPEALADPVPLPTESERLSSAPRVSQNVPMDDAVRTLVDETADWVDANVDDAEAWADYGKACHANELFTEAEIAYLQALSRDPSQASWWYHLARLAERESDLAQAVRYVDQSIAIDSGYVHSWWRRGDWKFDLQDLEAARVSYERALEVQPSSIHASLGMGRLEIERGELDKAITRIRNIVAAGNDTPYAKFLLGSALRKKGDLQAAQPYLSAGHSARIIRDDAWASELLPYRVGFGARVQLATQYFNDGQLDAAKNILLQLRTEDPNDVRMLTRLGQVHLRQGDVLAANEVLQDALVRHPDNHKVNLELVSVAQKMGQPEQALAYADRAVELKPALSLAHARRGTVLRGMKRNAEAAESFAAAIKYDPTEVRLWRVAGDTHASLRQWDLAIQHYNQAIELDGEDPELHALLGFASMQTGDLELAEMALRRSLELGPRRAENIQQLLAQVQRLRSSS